MHPVLFRIPGLDFPIRSFGVLVATGIFLGIWLWGYLLKRYGDDPEEDPNRGSQVALWIVVGVFLGARLMYVGVEAARYLGADKTPAIEKYLSDHVVPMEMTPEEREVATKIVVGHEFLHDPFTILFIWKGGLVMYGGLIGAILSGVWAGRRHGLKIWNGLDTALISGFLGLSLGRVGCLLVGDDHGKVVPSGEGEPSFPLSRLALPDYVFEVGEGADAREVVAQAGEVGLATVRVPDLTWLKQHTESLFDHDLAGKVLWSTQIWMSLNALLLVGVGLLLLKYRRWYGQVGSWLLIQYSVSRFVIEMFRGDEIRGVWFNGALSTSQLVSIFGFLAGVLLLVKRPGPDAPAKVLA